VFGAGGAQAFVAIGGFDERVSFMAQQRDQHITIGRHVVDD
jgi:hypothetical protein